MRSQALAAILILAATPSVPAADLSESFVPGATGSIGGIAALKPDCVLEAPSDRATPAAAVEAPAIERAEAPRTMVEEDFRRFKAEQAARACGSGPAGTEGGATQQTLAESFGGIGDAGEAVAGGGPASDAGGGGGGGGSGALSLASVGGGGRGGSRSSGIDTGPVAVAQGPSASGTGNSQGESGSNSGRPGVPGGPGPGGENPTGVNPGGGYPGGATPGGRTGGIPGDGVGSGPAVPGPIAGAGLPGLLALFGLWKVRRHLFRRP